MQQSQDIGNIRRELILKVLLAQRTEIDPPFPSANTPRRRQLLDKDRVVQKKAIEGLKVAA